MLLKDIAENIAIIEKPENYKLNDLVGKTIDGIVKNVAEFGIFVSLQGAPDGLIHKNSLSNDLKNNFKEAFIQGKKVRVKVEKFTQKGLQLKFIGDA